MKRQLLTLVVAMSLMFGSFAQQDTLNHSFSRINKLSLFTHPIKITPPGPATPRLLYPTVFSTTASHDFGYYNKILSQDIKIFTIKQRNYELANMVNGITSTIIQSELYPLQPRRF